MISRILILIVSFAFCASCLAQQPDPKDSAGFLKRGNDWLRSLPSAQSSAMFRAVVKVSSVKRCLCLLQQATAKSRNFRRLAFLLTSN